MTSEGSQENYFLEVLILARDLSPSTNLPLPSAGFFPILSREIPFNDDHLYRDPGYEKSFGLIDLI